MNVLAINASPPGDITDTTTVFSAFLDGMREAGAEVEQFDTSDLTLHPCRGDRFCQITTPGVCLQKDDMAALLRAYLTTDVLVLASPVCWDGVSAPLKTFIDRLAPTAEPFLESYGNGYFQPPRYEVIRRRRIVFVSGSICYEPETFDPVLAHIRALAKSLYAEYAGALLRPHAGAMHPSFAQERRVREILEAARDAGWDLVRVGSISQRILDRVRGEILSEEEYVRIFNRQARASRDVTGQPESGSPGIPAAR